MVKWVDNCEACLEDGNKPCNCGTNDEKLQLEVKNEVVDQAEVHTVKGKSSFLQSVMNMIGMLIGMFFVFSSSVYSYIVYMSA